MKESINLTAAALILAFVAAASASGQSPLQTAAPDTTGNSIPAPALPPGTDSNSQLAQVFNMLRSGAGENAILTDISQSGGPFDLNAADIAYLNDLGAPGDIESAMIQRDKALGVTDGAQAQQTASPDQSAQSQDITEDYFYGALAPYGKWIDMPGYGLCWQPGAAVYNSGWSPYCTQGQWIYTDSGWYWLSGYSWGWCVFHYGRWFHDASRGWCWWPSTTWAPSWVFWRYWGNYCGWAPLPPGCYYSQGNGLVYKGTAVAGGYDFGMGASLFNFVPLANLCDGNMEGFRLPTAQAAQVFARSKALVNINSNDRTIANDGISVQRILMVTGKAMRSFTIRRVKSVAVPGTRGEQISPDGETLAINRPYFKTGVASALRQGIWPVPSQEQPVAHQPPSIIMNENPASYAAADNQDEDNDVIYADSAAQNGPSAPTVTTAGPQDYGAPAPAQSYWANSAGAPAPIDNSSPYTSPRRQLREHWQHRVQQPANHREFNPPATGSRPGDHQPANHADSHPSQPDQGHGNGSGPRGGSGGGPSQSHSAPASAPSHGDKK